MTLAKLKRWLGPSLFVGGLLTAIQGCGLIGGETSSAEERLCTPGANVYCRCVDRTEGTKLCLDDGKSFAPCATNEARTECVGGEIQDPNTGKPVDSNGQPIDPADAGPTTTTNPLDVCPGKSTSLTPGVATVIQGDTTGATDDAKGKTGACAAGAGGPDHVYRIIPTGSGALSIKVQGTAPFNPTIYLRTTCGDENSQIDCGETTGAGGLEQIDTNVLTGHEYFLFVDGASSTAGKYQLTALLTTKAFCGDGKIDPGEACDDTNHVDDDGCSPDCRKPNGDPPSGNGCPGHQVDVWPGATVTGSASTLPYGNTWTNTGTSCNVGSNTANGAQDHVYEVVPHASGTLTVTATPTSSWNLMVLARKTCTDASSQLACANAHGSGDSSPETMTLPVTSGQPVYVAVDGLVSGKGTYDVSFSIQ